MSWVAKDISGEEYIFDRCPYREEGRYYNPWGTDGNTIKLPRGTIEKIIGRDLSWKEDPLELKEKR